MGAAQSAIAAIGKCLLLLPFMLVTPVLGDELDELKKQVAELQLQLKSMEAVIAKSDPEGLRTQDFTNQTITTDDAPAASAMLSPQQLQEIMKTLQAFQKNKKLHDEQLQWINKYFKIDQKP